MNVSFRRARRDDVPAIVGLLADDVISAGRETGPVDASGEVGEVYRTAFDAVDADPNQLLLVAEDDGRVVGTLQLTFIPGLSHSGAWRAQIEAVRVSSAERGNGLGGRMVRHAIDEARRRGCRLVQLTTDRRRTRAQAFYERLGFESTHLGMKLTIEPTGP